jgi:outer membrane usher protein FimD/PapC
MAKLSYGAGNSISSSGHVDASRELQSLLTGVVRKLNAGADVAAITSPDASDPASVITLANELKTKLELIIAAMKA